MAILKYILPDEFKKAVKEDWPVIIPSGCIELHGNHLPLGTDTIMIEKMFSLIEKKVEIIIAPSLEYGPTGYAVSGPKDGTMDIRLEYFKNYVSSIIENLLLMGFRRIYFIQHHQGIDGHSASALRMAISENIRKLEKLSGDGWFTNYFEQYEDLFPVVEIKELFLNIHSWRQGHAGKAETEPMMILFPELVRMERLRNNDFPYNWNKGNEVDSVNKIESKQRIENLISDWVDFLTAK